MIDLKAAIEQRTALVRDRIDAAAKKSGRDPGEVLLIAVTKTHGPDVVRMAYAAGLRHFGENRVEEAETKIGEVQDSLPQDATWHMIGHIQSRKAAPVARHFSWIHSVDRFKVARLLSGSLVEYDRSADMLLEVNLSGEETKSGYDLSRWPDDPAQERQFYAQIEQVLALPNLRLRGLMTIAPMADSPEQVRPVFRRMRQLRDAARDTFPGVDWQHLSMGMSGDFEVAIEEGATMIRVGTALFGPRT